MYLPDGVLDHVAVAVEDLEKSKEIYRHLGLVFDQEHEIVEAEGVETAFAPISGETNLELLSPHGEDGPIHRFLKKRGPGIHHLCFRVSDVKKTCEHLTELGYRLLKPEPTLGAGGKLVNFIHPKSTGGVLIEVSGTSSESPKDKA